MDTISTNLFLKDEKALGLITILKNESSPINEAQLYSKNNELNSINSSIPRSKDDKNIDPSNESSSLIFENSYENFSISQRTFSGHYYERQNDQVDIELDRSKSTNNSNACVDRVNTSQPSEEDSSHLESHHNYSEVNHDESFLTFLLKRLQISFWEDKKIEKESSKKGRGRPETNIDTSPEALNAFFINCLNEVEKKVSKSKQRSDAKTATIARELKKIPDTILKYIGSKCKYKSTDIYEVVESYAKAYILGYKKLMDIGELEIKDEFSMFFSFIILAFPDTKIKAILGQLKNESFFLSSLSKDNLL